MNSQQLLAHIGEINPEFVDSAERSVKLPAQIRKTTSFRFKRIAPLAACLVVVIAATVIFGSNAGWFAGRVYTAHSGDGTLSFHKRTGGIGSASYAYAEGIDCTTRELTNEETSMLFGNAFGTHNLDTWAVFSLGDKWGPDGTLIHVSARALDNEGNYHGGLQIIMAQVNNSIVESMMIDTPRNASEINGIQVYAGYFITNENSRGERNIIYSAMYEAGGDKVYVQNGGSIEDSEELRLEIAHTVDVLTQNGAPKLVSITENIDD